jgi:predicted glycoside hydrolase/deacetylase ChbG (UPF0249 family)
MIIPDNLRANADDFGLNESVNKAILISFERGYINSTSLVVNTPLFDDTVTFIDNNPIIHNIGLHLNLATDKPVSNFKYFSYLDNNGNWDLEKTNKKIAFFSGSEKKAFFEEIIAQIEKAKNAGIQLTHIDSHHHVHTLPRFFNLFLKAAKMYNLPLRLAQTYNEGNQIKYLFRKHINNKFKEQHLNYSDRFETVTQFCKTAYDVSDKEIVEIMLHPGMDLKGGIIDHYDPSAMVNWLAFLEKFNALNEIPVISIQREKALNSRFFKKQIS